MKITKIEVFNFKSIGAKPVKIRLDKKVNVLIGANNSGKSNVIHALDTLSKWVNAILSGRKAQPLAEIDFHKRNGNLLPEIKIIYDVKACEEFGISEAQVNNDVYLTFQMIGDNMRVVDSFIHNLDFPAFHMVFRKMKNQKFTSIPSDKEVKGHADDIVNAGNVISNALKPLPVVKVIPQFRQINSQDTANELSGSNIIPLLIDWQHPEDGDEEKHVRFNKIQELMRKLLHQPNAILEVRAVNNKIIIKNEDQRFPLESYGTGVHELIILAAGLFSYEKVIFCIEEPEIHLHPRLQRELLRFLQEETSNNYVLSTHSNALLTLTDDIQILHLWLENGATASRYVESSLDALPVLEDLGVQASDLLQANSVIWVEGPSDKIYLKCWISLLWPGLREGIDYVIMHYGGKLLSHISMERDVVDEQSLESLIHLLRINQRSAIIIDSDRNKKGDRINKTKSRIKKECEDNKVFCWITHGREIENYLPGKVVTDTYYKQFGLEKKVTIEKYNKIDDVLRKVWGNEYRGYRIYEDNKPRLARQIAVYITEEHIGSELRSSLNRLFNVIRPID